MTKWEITAYYVELGLLVNPSKVWKEKDEKTGKSDWDQLQELASQGWELVSVTPITNRRGTSTQTQYLLYTFKRPVAS